jgi:molybdopterin/thiamine biosynthesis adenylyltransferase
LGDALWTIDATLKAKGFTLQRPPLVYRGQISVHGQNAEIEINIPNVAFAALPEVKLLDRSGLSVREIAHVNGDGVICYVGEGGLPLDMYNPGGSVLRILEEVEATLARSFGGRSIAEFEAELASYWKGIPVLFAVCHRGDRGIISADLLSEGGMPYPIVVEQGKWQHVKASRRAATILAFPTNLRHGREFPPTHLAAVVDYIATHDPPDGWRDAVLAAAASSHAVFLLAPNAIFGWVPDFPPSLNAIKTQSRAFRAGYFRSAMERVLAEVKVDRMTGIDASLRFSVERNLAGRNSLIGKQIALVGCGTIGSHLGKLLVQSGAGCEGTLSLYDTDKVSPGNLGRHLLGFNEIGREKAQALADHLRTFHPDISVKAFCRDATKEWSKLELSDLVIDATGDWNVASILNDMTVRSKRKGLAVLHSWVFGNGVAAQSFLNLNDGLACFRCLKTGFEGQWRYNPLKDVTSAVRQAPARCGEAGYIPFSVDAPVAAASLSIRAILDWAAGQPGQRLRTIVLDHKEGRESVKWVSPSRLDNCPACGK